MTPITVDWLRLHGFKYHDVERSGRHWLLWIGWAMPHRERSRMITCDDFGIELTPRINSEAPEGSFALFFRADYAGRYSRFLFCRDVVFCEDLTQIVETLIGARWMDCHTCYGFLARPDQARRIRVEDERVDIHMARYREQVQGLDPDRATHV